MKVGLRRRFTSLIRSWLLMAYKASLSILEKSENLTLDFGELINLLERLILVTLGERSAHSVLKLGLFGRGISLWKLAEYDAGGPHIGQTQASYRCGKFKSVARYCYDSGIPVFWRMSDMWAVTGGCHYSGGCSRYTNGCDRCPFSKEPKNPFNCCHTGNKKAERNITICDLSLPN